MATFATVEDVATELGRPIEAASPEGKQIAQWLSRVEARIRLRVPDIDALAMEAGYAERLRGVEVDVVARKARNPDGKSYERIDDYGYGLGSAAQADLTLTDAEWAEVLPQGLGSAWSIIPAREVG